MDVLEVIIPIVVFIIWVVGLLGKRKARKSRADGSQPSKPSALAQVFNEIRKEIKAAIERAKEEENRRKMRLPGEEGMPEIDAVEEALEFDLSKISEARPPKSPPSPTPPVPVVDIPPIPVVPKVAAIGLGSPGELRRAIALSEILGPPVSLRRDDH